MFAKDKRRVRELRIEHNHFSASTDDELNELVREITRLQPSCHILQCKAD